VYLQQVQDAAESSASLAKQMTKAGNFSQRDQMREQLFYAQAMAEFQRAQQASVEAREQLARLLALADGTTIKLPNRLPNLPNEIPSQFAQQSEVESVAMKQRLDIQAMQQETQGLAKRLGLTKTTRFINVLEVGPARVLEGGRNDNYKNGVDISVELPIFDFGQAKVARAEAIYMQAVNRLTAQAVNARSQVRLAYRNYHIQYVLAKQYQDQIIPLRKRMAEESLLRYNGMFISVFELLQDAQLQVNTTNQYIQTLRDYWVATSDLEMVMMGNPVSGASRSQKETSSW
jgi:outer membrane protein TolC